MDAKRPGASPPPDEAAGEEMTAEQRQALEAARSLRGQIAALRQQVRDAQNTLRDHARPRRDPRPKR